MGQQRAEPERRVRRHMIRLRSGGVRIEEVARGDRRERSEAPFEMETWLSGRKRHLAKVLNGNPVPKVRILPSPQFEKRMSCDILFLWINRAYS